MLSTFLNIPMVSLLVRFSVTCSLMCSQLTCYPLRFSFRDFLGGPVGRSPQEEIATHSSTFDWKIPWTEEPGRLQSMGSQRAGHDWATEGGGPVVNNLPCNTADTGSVPGHRTKIPYAAEHKYPNCWAHPTTRESVHHDERSHVPQLWPDTAK